MSRTTRILLVVCGFLLISLGILGMFLPILPTTPFLLLASYCFTRSSKRLDDWLKSNRWFGTYIRNYREGKGVTLGHKVITISLLWLTIGYTAWRLPFWWVQLILAGVAIGVFYHLVRMKTYRPGSLKSIQPVKSSSQEALE